MIKNTRRLVLFLLILAAGRSFVAYAQTGTSCSNPYVIYPATSCTNTCGNQFCGNMQCPTGNCGSYVIAAGSSGGLNPGCTTDNETTQNVIWLRVTATASTFTINNGSPYTGSSASNANRRDYAVYTGTCGNLTQIACGSIAGSSAATVTGLVAGQTYYIMISPSSLNTTATATSICITSTVGYVAPGNTCANAVNLTTNTTYTFTNAGATADAVICNGSVENNVWYRWCAPANWPVGQVAYISVNNQVCNASQGLQLSVWNTGNTCPVSTANQSLICQNPGTLTQYYYQWTAVANQCYYITIDGYAGTACSYNLTVGSVVVLPIELLEFQAEPHDGLVELVWTTASETNNDYFTVERSANGTDYETVAQVEGSGTTSYSRHYSAVDPQPFTGISYYRLKQTDFDGTFSYSLPVAVKNNTYLQGLSLAPNPAASLITVRIQPSLDGEQTLRIYAVSGQLLLEKKIPAGNQIREESLDISGFDSGVYNVVLETPETVYNERLFRRD
ncbi:MAG: hypothetical protein RL021_912 [Bacteroidota bacterium]|jgi:hypothetical protein